MFGLDHMDELMQTAVDGDGYDPTGALGTAEALVFYHDRELLRTLPVHQYLYWSRSYAPDPVTGEIRTVWTGQTSVEDVRRVWNRRAQAIRAEWMELFE
jgi:hypothetical protein